MIETEAELSAEIQGPKKIEPTIEYNDDGTFSVTYVPETAGEYAVAVKLNDLHINGSPWTVVVQGARFYLLFEKFSCLI